MELANTVGAAGGGAALPVASAQDLACDTEPSLMDFIGCVRAAAPGGGSELYVFPSIADSLDFAFVVEQMMSDMDDGVFDCDAVVPIGLDEHYRVSTLQSNGREFCVLHEFLDANGDDSSDLGWGTFLYAPDAHNEIDLQAPHIRGNIFTEFEAVELFELTHSRSALIGGAHPEANDAESICQARYSYLEANAAHNIDTFYAAGKAVAMHYGAEEVGGVVDFSDADPAFHALQFHGMAVTTCVGDHVFLSNGDGSPVLIGDAAQQLADALQDDHPGWNVAFRGDGVSTCNQYGSRNTLSRYFNGIEDDGGDDLGNPICSHDGNHPAVSARFIHVEQKRCTSGTSCQYGSANTIRSATNWSDAIIEVFTVPTCTDGVHNGGEDGVDCGGSCPLTCGPSCSNGVQDGDEDGVDCGGSCPATCGPSCSNGVQDGDEVGVDCGGSCPATCGPSCSNGVQDGDEVGVDCGGSCPLTCGPSCSNGVQDGDEVGVDCGGSCPLTCGPSCSNGVQDGDEVGVDCGGSCPLTCGPSCSNGIHDDFEWGIDCGGPCPTPCPTCKDGVQNGGELGIDCGGPCLLGCSP
ncbi:hypothetical protein [Paraliomyxa miuraensis]|uniref:hypothetical protein n=1 Tax=Paraliomyxa miuraensis TaxID=376150 RepID=UPI0022519397|nr:hypothetical protein [Paraliomyxa miuraensis]MCX4243280.1 hypothetical protein [Paraliomyxa miuraensis]